LRSVLPAAVLLLLAFGLPSAADLRPPPAPDDLFDPDLIDLDLDAIIAEKEKLFSLSFSIGTSQSDLATTRAQAASITSIKSAYDSLAVAFEDVTGIDIRWTKDSFEGQKPVLDLFGSVRFKLPESITMPGVGGRLGLEIAGGRTGTSTRFSETGLGASITDEAWIFSGRALYYLPETFTGSGWVIFPGVEKREVYLGLGAGRAFAKHSIEMYTPDPNLSGIGEFSLFEATGSSNTFDLLAGAEEYFTPFLSLNVELGYQWLRQEELKYTDPERVADSDLLINEGEVATSWGPWFPEGMIPLVATAADLEYGYDRGEDPIVVDYSGFSLRAGLRYHF